MNKINFFYVTTDDLPMTIATIDSHTKYNVPLKLVTGFILEKNPTNYYIRIADHNGIDILNKQVLPTDKIVSLGSDNGIATQLTTTLTISQFKIYQNIYFKFFLYNSDQEEIDTADTMLFSIGVDDYD